MSDLIRRQDVLKICDKYNGQGWVWSMIRKEVEELPCDGCCTAHSGYEAGMTREEMEELKGLAASMGLYDDKNPCKRAVILGKAIKALEQEPSEDMVSRGVFEQVRWERDVAISQLKELGYELGQKVEPCDDAISRQAALDCFTATKLKKFDFILYAREEIKKLPPVNLQEPKTVLYSGDGYADGYMVYDMAECPNCGYEYEDGDKDWGLSFCPSCGQKLNWESEDQ